MQAELQSEIEALIAPAVAALGLEVWGVELALSRGSGLLRVYIDHAERAVTLDDCEAASREISALLDVNDLISGRYTLEVSSPGVDRPLFAAAHYLRFLGSAVKLSTSLPRAGRRRFGGTIAAVDGQRITLATESGPMELDIAEIDKARLQLPANFGMGESRPRRGRKTDE